MFCSGNEKDKAIPKRDSIDENQQTMINIVANVMSIIRPITDYNNTLNEKEGLRLCELLNASNVLRDKCINKLIEEQRHAEALKVIVNNWEQITHNIIEMSKQLTLFTEVCNEDQIALIKYGCIEMSCIRHVMAYDTPNSLMTITMFYPQWNCDPVIMDLMIAITLFNPNRPNLIYRDVVKLQQHIYIYLLQRYLQLEYHSMDEAKSRLIKLLKSLHVLRTLNEMIAKDFYEYGNIFMGPLYKEIYGL
ncbi:unnamed protein product [Oppiella nova]|uniref:NR LBD domain-containing protein n=1 Tax=Oppiella nova TaxID=334625 RepID=A0A7R9MA61_9ACAR|nr:unnamed protein product [Oppiella nova]CAG2173564.1 unnamed protein product [Oppiella nova]